MLKTTTASILAIALALIPIPGPGASAQTEPLTLEVIFSPDDEIRIDFGGSPQTDLVWLDDGTHYLQPSPDRELFESPLKVEAARGRSSPLFETPQMTTALARLAGFTRAEAAAIASDNVHFSRAHDALIVRHAGDLFHYRLAAQRAVRLTDDASAEEVEEFSPDGRFVSFVRDHNLYVVDVDSQRERALTRDGGPNLLFGRLDWVYQEELYGRGNFRGHWWSPDSTRIAFLKLDESSVRRHLLVDHLPTRPESQSIRYPKAGDANPRVELGVARALGGETVWVDTSRYQPLDHLIVRVGWTRNGGQVVFLVQDREQTWLDINLADPVTGSTTRLLRESSPAFIDVDLTGEPYWLNDGSFLWRSGRTGFHHLYHFAPDGTLRRQLTDGEWEVRDLYGVDEAGGWVYFSASEHSPIEIHLYRVQLDGSSFERLSRRSGTHSASFDPTFSRYLDTWSDIRTPPKVFLYRADGTELRVVDANEVAALEKYRLGETEFLQVQTPDGVQLEAALVKPADFDPSRKYPVLQYNYGGPHAQVVRNAWADRRNMWLHLLAQEGFVVWLCDNRSASGKGIEPTWQAYQRLGEVELEDIETGLAWLKSQPWVDAERIGIYGWSYGGFMAAFALTHSQSFKIGIAGAPVTDWRLYDTIYTERLMRMPQNNPEGYDATSVVKAAGNLHGKLLLIHGTLDDNVHLQNTLQLAHALQAAGKDFDLMLYPASRHRVSDPQQRYHLFRLMTRFLQENL